MKISHLSGICLLSLALTLSPAAAGHAQESDASLTPDHIVLSWTGDPATTMTITWRTVAAIASCSVEYDSGLTISSKSKQAKANAHDFVNDLGTSRIFSANLSNLSPDRKYTYRIDCDNQQTKSSSFTTAREKTTAYKFLVFGDSQSPVTGDSPYGTWRETVHNAYQANPDAKFMVNVGDLVDFGQQQAHWNAWFAAAKGVIDNIPVMPVSGNHESYGPKEIARPKYYLEQFSLPQNGPEGLKGQAYSFDYGFIHFVMLDSQQLEQKQSGDILNIQQAWLEADLAASKAPWKIAFFHRSPYGVKPGRKEEEIQKAFCPILEKHHVNLVFNAHDHGVAWTPPIKNGAPAASAADGTVYLVSGQSGGKVYTDNVKMAYHSFFYNPLDQPNYWVIEATTDKITIKAVKQNGVPINSFSIDSTGKFDQKDQMEFKKAS